MQIEIYTVFDSAAKAFLQPFFARSKGEAIRSFTDVVNTNDHQFNKHVHDYSLFHIGSYDDGSAIVTPVGPARIVTAIEVLAVDDVFPPEKKVS